MIEYSYKAAKGSFPAQVGDVVIVQGYFREAMGRIIKLDRDLVEIRFLRMLDGEVVHLTYPTKNILGVLV